MKRQQKAAARPWLPTAVMVITIVILIVLILVLYPWKIAVGKAFYTEQIGSAGIRGPAAAISAGTPFSVAVEAHIGSAQTVSIFFQLELPAQMSCADVRAIESELAWEGGVDSALVSMAAECTNDMIMFEYATLDADEALNGEIAVAEISFDGQLAGTYQFDFTAFEILDLDGVNRITAVPDAEIQVSISSGTGGGEGAGRPPGSDSSGGAGGGGSGSRSTSGGGGRRCVPQWVCLSWSSCANGQQIRPCVDERRCGTTSGRPAVERSCTITVDDALVDSTEEGSVEQEAEPIAVEMQKLDTSVLLKEASKRRGYWVGAGTVVILAGAAMFWYFRSKKRPVKARK